MKTDKINIALVGYGTVGSGVVKILKKKKHLWKKQFDINFELKTICDRSVHTKDTQGLVGTNLTTRIDDVLNDPDVNIVIELIGGINPAKDIILHSLKNGKDVITANKELLANFAPQLFQCVRENKRHLLFESAVGAGIPIIKTMTEGIIGNRFKGIYGIINGTSNFILDEMTRRNFSFDEALAEAQRLGYAESDPTLDVSGMDSAHKLGILIYLAFGKHLNVKDIYTEGIQHISHVDIEHAESLNLCIKLLAIAKETDNTLEARVHPTLIAKNHPLANIQSIYNAFYLDLDPVGHILLSGEGAGQMSAASGVISDLINCVLIKPSSLVLNPDGDAKLEIRKIDHIQTKFYINIKAMDKPGVLSEITGILGRHGISINSVTQKAHDKLSTVPVIMLTDFTTESVLRLALDQIQHLPSVKGKPVAIRMEKLW